MDISLSNLNDFSINNLIGEDLNCSCGKHHFIDMKRVIIEEGAIHKIAPLLQELKYKKALILSDKITWDIAAEKVAHNLEAYSFPYKKCILEGRIHPDEKRIVEVLVNLEPEIDIILAVGTGVICDMAKFIGSRLNKDVAAVITAPSVDGFASKHAALVVNNLKVSFDSVCPKIIIGDVDVLKNAPMPMIIAGWCDIMGKYSALSDWQLGKIINDEYYCEVISSLVKKSVDICHDNLKAIKERKPAAIGAVMKGLILTGIAMGLLGNSRPASGSEHHLSHCWEMKNSEKNWHLAPHGIQVGVGEVLVAKLYEKLRDYSPDFKELQKLDYFDEELWAKSVANYFGTAGDKLIADIRFDGRYKDVNRQKRLLAIEAKWQELQKVIKAMPTAAAMQNLMQEANTAIFPEEFNISTEDAIESIEMAKEVRDKYTVLRLLDDLNLLKKFATEIA